MLENKSRGIPGKIFWLAGIILGIKLILLPFAQNTDPDAVLRVFGASEWRDHPVWITSGVWGPFHTYLNGIALMIWNNKIYAPVILNLLLSSLTLFPFYFFTRREFNERGAFIATIFFSICPVLFRISFLPLSETPYLFLIALTINFLSKGIREEKRSNFLLAGLFITLASGFRYEAWLLIILFGIVIVLAKRFKEAFLFTGVAIAFPVVWLVQNYMVSSNPLNSFQWAINAMNNKEVLYAVNYLRRTWFFPFSLVVALGPPVAFITIRFIAASYKKENRELYRMIWTIPFWGTLFFFFYNDFRGALLLQHRFTGTLVMLSLPYFALYFKDWSSYKIRNAVMFGITTIGLSFAWNTEGVTPLPRLKDQTGETVAALIENKIDSHSGLIIDFWNWGNTYYIAHRSGLPLNNIVIIFGTDDAGIQKERIQQILTEHHEGVIVLKKNSILCNEVETDGKQLRFKWIESPVKVEDLFQNDEVMAFRYAFHER